MAITAEVLYQASQLEPADLGEDIIDPDEGEPQQKAAAIAWVAANVLPIAESEVGVPLLKVTGYDNIADFIGGRFPGVGPTVREGWIARGNSLYDGAVLSYGRSEINKCINSTSETYDRDSDQDRIQGNQRLAKLLEWAEILIRTGGHGSAHANDAGRNIASTSIRNVFVY